MVLTGNLNPIVRMNQLVVLVPRHSRNRISIDVASDGDVAAFRELILSYRYVGCDRHCETIDHVTLRKNIKNQLEQVKTVNLPSSIRFRSIDVINYC